MMCEGKGERGAGGEAGEGCVGDSAGREEEKEGKGEEGKQKHAVQTIFSIS